MRDVSQRQSWVQRIPWMPLSALNDPIRRSANFLLAFAARLRRGIQEDLVHCDRRTSMTSKQVVRRWIAAADVATLMLASGCAMLAPKMDAFEAPPVGSTWTTAQVNTGSYGSGTPRIVITRGERAWQGRQAIAYQGPSGSTIADSVSGKWIALLGPNDAVAVTWDPPLGYEFPIVVGKTWVSRHRVDNRMTGRAVDFEATWNVEAYEDVTVPAGTFKAYRVRYSDTLGNVDMYWSSPALGINVKSSQTRSASHSQGTGTRETELVAHTIR
jgi:hypothetical protein